MVDPDKAEPRKPPKKSDGFLASAARYTSIAMTLPGATFAGYLIGYGLDQWLHTSYLKIVFLILGILSGFYELIRGLLRDMNAENKAEKADKADKTKRGR